ncbi:beta-1,3-galactosyltransferase 6-like [Ischnura elegans]|uniref:beta-1,3-galactosyltransferase 6-like n=1 Tax=Ischnura elegans TaxID=197161 RepID=UPI001ED8771C|nr:beta-1,3-galactosyltransferase 6-like [Ischnura elegans]
MRRNCRLFIYCSFSFILGCTISVCVMRYDECPDHLERGVTGPGKLPQEHVLVIGKDSRLKSHVRESISSFLVVMIMSSPDNIQQRTSIRETWATYGEVQDVRYFFFVGTKNLTNDQSSVLVKEYEDNEDLVLFAEVLDSYEDLTTKLLHSFTWLSNAVNFSFVLKCDDDTFVRMPAVLKELKKSFAKNPQKRLYWGFFDGRAHVRRSGKWAESNWVICDRYLPYALGGGYVLSKELVNLLAHRAAYLELYRNEDAAVGAWLSTVRGLERKHDPRFDTEYISRGCNEEHLLTHKVSPQMMRTLYSSLKTRGKFCPSGEFALRHSYLYNWDVPPSRCCVRTNSSVP